MYQRIVCPRCHSKFLSKIRRNKRRFRVCYYEFTPWLIKGVRLKDKSIKQIINWFLLERSGWWIARELNLNKNQVYKVIKQLRQVMTKDVPSVFAGTVEVDETYLGGKRRNKRKSQLKKDCEKYGSCHHGFGTNKQAVFGILCRSGKVYAHLIEGNEARNLIPIITKKVKPGTHIYSDTWRAYTGLATKGYVHRTVAHKQKQYVKGKVHINGLEGFWGYLKRKLATKGGVRREYLHLYLGEYVWRYNFKDLTIKQQRDRLITLLKKERFGG